MNFYEQHPELDQYGECTANYDNDWQIRILYHEHHDCDLGEFPEDSGIDMSNHRDWKGGEYGEACPVNVGEFLHWYNIVYRGDGEHGYDGEENWAFMQFMKNYHWLPVYMYDHSGRTVNTTGFSCRWDSGCAGLVFWKKSAFIKNGSYGVKKHWKADKRDELANKLLVAWVKELDDYMTGNIFGFQVGQEMGGEFDEVDSCWGYVGDQGREDACQEALNILEGCMKGKVA